jgi:hypothetical protein
MKKNRYKVVCCVCKKPATRCLQLAEFELRYDKCGWSDGEQFDMNYEVLGASNYCDKHDREELDRLKT